MYAFGFARLTTRCLWAQGRWLLSTLHATRMSRILGVFLGAVAAALVLVDCSANLPETSLDYKSRATTRTEGGVRVSTAVLSADESAAVYGVPLATRSIQPVWIEVENREDRAYYLLSPGLDPNFFPASEASEAVASGESPDQKAELDRRFRQLAFRNPVLPGATTSGFVLTNLDEGFKLVQIDLVSGGPGENLLDPLHRARLSLRLPRERSLQAGYLPSREGPELHR